MLRYDSRADAGNIRRMAATGALELVDSNTFTNGLHLKPFKVQISQWSLSCMSLPFGSSHAEKRIYAPSSPILHAPLVRAKISVVYEHISRLPKRPGVAERRNAHLSLGFGSETFVVGGCGAQHWRKGQDFVPQLLIALRRLMPTRDVRFLWVGRPGTRDEEVTLAHDLKIVGLTEKFHSAGEVADPFAYYNAMDAFALLSREDPYPLACLEAAALGIPIACFEGADGIPQFVAGGCGLMSPYLDVSAMANSIARFATDQEFARSRAESARDEVVEQNLPEKTGPQLLSIVEAAMASRR